MNSSKVPPDPTRLLGEVLENTVEGLMAEVVPGVGHQRITAIITADAIADLNLNPGDSAVAIFEPATAKQQMHVQHGGTFGHDYA